MSFLALDIATKTGWCVSKDGAIVDSGSIDLAERFLEKKDRRSRKGSEGVRYPELLLGIEIWLDEMLERHGFDHVVIEADFSRGVALLQYFQGVVIVWARRNLLGCLPVDQQEWRKSVLGQSQFRGPEVDGIKATKWAAINHVRNVIPDIGKDHDRAEAVCIAEYAERFLIRENGTRSIIP